MFLQFRAGVTPLNAMEFHQQKTGVAQQKITSAISNFKVNKW